MAPHYTLALDQAIAWIKSNFAPLGILAGGSIIRGNPDANSDFDLYVVHDQAFRQRVQQKFNGVPCEIFINNEAQIRSYFASELRSNRPVTANMLATGQVVYGQHTPLMLALVAEAKYYATYAQPLTDEQLTFRKYAVATLFEDATDTLGSDAPTTHYLLDRAISQVIELVFAARQQPLPRWKERLSTLAQLDPTIGQLLQRYYEESGLAQKHALAASLVGHVTGALGFFEWSSTPA